MSEIVTCPSCGTKNRVPVVAAGTPRCASCKAALAWLVNAGDADFDAAVDTTALVLVDLWAPWCGPCRMVAPGVEQAAAELAGRLKAVKVNVDEAPGISARFGAQSIPTLLLMRGGKVVERQVGALPAHRLLAWIKQALVLHPA
ncbi:MAG TPA: thioredoxin [Ilumatobacteraceae bacterium]|nr:thioredoxin [Ilumatobacteraceae bacterium]